ncbi:MAG: metallophosphoesterase [Myxococcota bacterium]
MAFSTAHLIYLAALFALTMAVVWRRSVFFRRFVGVMLGLLSLLWLGLFSQLDWPLGALAMALELLSAIHLMRLRNARLRSVPYRAFISIPGLWFAASTFVALPFAILGAFGVHTPAFLLAFAAGAFGVYQSLSHRLEVVDLKLDGEDRGELKPTPVPRRALKAAPTHEGRPMRIVQITDPHLGPFMSVAQLRAVCERAVAMDPDLVLITGDLLTMESHNAAASVAEALSPLRALSGRVFACHGNHDHEDRRTVREGLEGAGVRLLVDEWARVSTPAGQVDIVGADYHWKARAEKLRTLFDGHERDGTPRILLLHHPGHIRDVPEGEADLTLSGHTHGGHVGLLSLGLQWTFVRGFSSMPDHGLWSRGRDRIYTHRGTGHYGFPVRLGVPREESLLRVWFDGPAQAA